MFFRNDNDNEKPAALTRRVVPALPLRDIIVFPHMVSQLFVGREKSIAALDEAMARDKEVLLAAQKSAKTNDPTPDDVYSVGTLGTIVQLLRLADGTVKAVVEHIFQIEIEVDIKQIFIIHAGAIFIFF